MFQSKVYGLPILMMNPITIGITLMIQKMTVTNNYVDENQNAHIDVYLDDPIGFTVAKVNLITGQTMFTSPRFQGGPEVIKSIASILPNIEGSVSVATNIDEETQMSSFQNASLHGINGELACSIAVNPAYPTNLESQEQFGSYLQAALSSLTSKGWDFEIQIGKTS